MKPRQFKKLCKRAAELDTRINYCKNEDGIYGWHDTIDWTDWWWVPAWEQVILEFTDEFPGQAYSPIAIFDWLKSRAI
jgi:hypothetical protein